MPLALIVFAALMLAACGGNGEAAEDGQPAAPTSAATTKTATRALVGRWKQVHTCEQLVRALAKEGLKAIAPAMIGDYFPGTSPKQLAKKPDVCSGAKPQAHYHFFDAAGQFGSLNQNEEQVDENTYEIVDGTTLRIGRGEFRYRIANGNTLMLEPVIPKSERRRALAQPLKFSPAGWQVSVSYPGHPWKRVECDGWC